MNTPLPLQSVVISSYTKLASDAQKYLIMTKLYVGTWVRTHENGRILHGVWLKRRQINGLVSVPRVKL